MKHKIEKIIALSNTKAAGEKPALEIQLDMIALRERFKTQDNYAVFAALSESDEDHPLTAVGSYFYRPNKRQCRQ